MLENIQNYLADDSTHLDGRFLKNEIICRMCKELTFRTKNMIFLILEDLKTCKLSKIPNMKTCQIRKDDKLQKE